MILTNLACYLLAADGGVQVRWRTSYGSNGANEARPESATPAGACPGAAGTSPTLTDDLVLFTDNLDPLNLLALSCRDGGNHGPDPGARCAGRGRARVGGKLHSGV